MPAINNKPVEHIIHKTQSRPFSLHHTVVYPGAAQPLYLHCHPEIEMFMLIEGSVVFHIENNEYNLHAGDAIMIPPNLLHYATRTKNLYKPCSFYAIVFSPDMLMEVMPSYCEHYFTPINYHSLGCIIPLHRSESWMKTVINCLVKIFEQYETDIKSSELIIRGNLLIAWQLLYNNHMYKLITDSSDRHINPLLKKCADYMDANYMQALTLDELSDMAGLSTGHFCRMFKEFTGYTPFSYINRKRISASCSLLLESDKKIADIASLCGYNNISYYNRAFIKLMKETPSSYRKNYKM